MMYRNVTRKKIAQNWRIKKNSHWRKRTPKQLHPYAKLIQKMQAEAEADRRNTEYWNEIKPILQKMHNELIALGGPPNYNETEANIYYYVKISDIASRCQDSLKGGKIIEVYPGKISDYVNKFNNDLYFIGRHTMDDTREDPQLGPINYWNTSRVGEKVTIRNIFFGPDLGLERKSAEKWLKTPKTKTLSIFEPQFGPIDNIRKSKNIWVTEGLVRGGINHLNKLAYSEFIEILEIMVNFEF